MKKNSRIYIAGHNGMVGSSIFRELKKNGFTNLLVISSSELDLRNQNDVFHFFKNENPEIVINAAAKVGGILANNDFPYEFLMENMQIQNNLIDCSFKFNVEKFIFLEAHVFTQNFHHSRLRKAIF